MLETIRSFPTLPIGIFEVGRRRYGIQAHWRLLSISL